jgi:cytochrome c peroxidase
MKFRRAACVLGAVGVCALSAAMAGQPATPSLSALPAGAPAWLPPSYFSLIGAPLPRGGPFPGAGSVPNGTPRIIPEKEFDIDAAGVLESLQPAGPTVTAGNAFFQSLGTNGRACVTCHQPANAMSLSVVSIQQRFAQTRGMDPLFAPVDGSNCPASVGPPPVNPANFSLILTQGLFRIALPVPANAQFTIAVVSDPYGCNTNPAYNQSVNPTTGVTSQIVSVYRRPLMAANLKFKVETGVNNGQIAPSDPITGLPLPIDPATGQYESGNIMSDGREPTLSSQATDATLTHAQAKSAPTAAQVAQMVDFESGMYEAQALDNRAGSLNGGGANGGPFALFESSPGLGAQAGQEVVSAYDAWNPAVVASESAARASIYRGQQLFNFNTFIVSNDAGINNIPHVPNGIPTTCSGCHGQINGTTEEHPNGQHSIGIGGIDAALGGPAPANNLPIFMVTCNAGYTTPFNGSVVLTNDPGKALITGLCEDIGRFTTPQLRGLSARAPYFSDGSAATLADVLNIYNKRFDIGLTAQNMQDLGAFLASL